MTPLLMGMENYCGMRSTYINRLFGKRQHPSGIYYFKLTAGDKVAVRKGVYQK